jgi:lipoprotein signal peptidase
VSVMDADGTNVKLIFRADEGAVALAPEWSPKDLGWWPIFNSADVSITIGVLIALWFLR